MNIETQKLEIRALKDRLTADRRLLAAAEQDLAEELCPFSVGDRLSGECENYLVASIDSQPCGDRFSIRVYKIKKDGTPFKFSNRFYGDVRKLRRVK